MRPNSKILSVEEVDTAPAFAELRQRFSDTRLPIEVNFRDLVSWIPYNSERFSHLLHPYPAKLIPHIPHFFLSNRLLSEQGDQVLDPFCGTGTVLLEACLLGRQALGCDSNPLARLISRVKTRIISPAVLKRHLSHFTSRLPNCSPGAPPDVVNLEYWFYPHVIRSLCRILSCIHEIKNLAVRELFLVAFSVCVRKVSLTDPRVSVPVRLRPERYPEGHPLRESSEILLRRLKRINVEHVFREILADSINRVTSLYLLRESIGTLSGVFSNACKPGKDTISEIPKHSISLILTSPPYLGAQKYVRAASLSMGWLSLCPSNGLRNLEDHCVGREHYPTSSHVELRATGIPDADAFLQDIHKQYPLRAHIAAEYLREMSVAFSQCARVLKKGGRFVLVAGANTVCGLPFDTPACLQNLAVRHGFKTELVLVDHIKSRGLMTKRNKTAGLIPAEKVMVFTYE